MSLIETFRARAAARPDDPAVIFLKDGETESDRLSYGDLQTQASRCAAGLAARGLGGRPLLLAARPDRDFVVALLGCLSAGVVGVPAPPQARGAGGERLRGMARAAGVVGLLGGLDVASLAEAAQVPWLDLHATETVGDADVGLPSGQAIALLQYTSGSTASPKGVVVTHSNLAANVQMVREAFAVHAGSRLLSWLPLFHDMGLMGLFLSLHSGMACVLAPPLSFLQRPQRWPRAVARYGVTISGAPNFAFELCARRTDPAALEGLDLSHWAVAFCGAERVRAETLDRFAAAMQPAGFRPGALYPCYGLAEATVFVSGGPFGRGVRSWETAGGAPAVVSCGPPPSNEIVAVVDPETRMRLAEGKVGEIWVAGPHVSAGYWRDPAATADTFGFGIAPEAEGAFMRTGDLGFLLNGEIYVTGRLKDLIVHRGGNLHPEDLEATIAASHSGFAAFGAAFAIELEGEDRVASVHELAPGRAAASDLEAMVDAALNAVAERHGVRLYDVSVVRSGALPRTTSGKVRRSEVRRLYLADELELVIGESRNGSLGRLQNRSG